MSTSKTNRIRCPECAATLDVRIPEGCKEGARIGVTCICGQRLRFRYVAPRRDDWLRDAERKLDFRPFSFSN